MTKHLTEEEIAMCAEALEKGSYHSMPYEVREHIAHCDQCADEILTVADIASDEELKLTPIAPKKDKTQKIIAWSVSIAAAIALVLLLFDLSDHGYKKQQTPLLSEKITNTTPDTVKDNSNATTKEVNKGIKQTTEHGTISEPDSKQAVNEQPKSHAMIARNQEKDQLASEEGNPPLPAAGAPSETMPATGAPTASLPPHLRENADTIRFLARFEPDENLEKLVDRYRGHLRSSDEVEITTPVSINSANSSVTITWKNPNKKRLIIEIFDNEGLRILEVETTHEEYTLKNLKNGLYYWKLISDNFELLFCGKIKVILN